METELFCKGCGARYEPGSDRLEWKDDPEHPHDDAQYAVCPECDGQKFAKIRTED